LQQESRDRKASASMETNPVLRFFKYVLAHPLLYQCISECFGTFILTWIITCNIAGAVIADTAGGLWDVAIICGLGLMLAIFCTAAISGIHKHTHTHTQSLSLTTIPSPLSLSFFSSFLSFLPLYPSPILSSSLSISSSLRPSLPSGGHLNPAVSLAFALVRPEDFPFKKFFPYVISQFVGAFLAGLLTYGLWFSILEDYFEAVYPQFQRGKDGSARTEIIFAGLVPNPSYPYAVPVKGFSFLFPLFFSFLALLPCLSWSLPHLSMDLSLSLNSLARRFFLFCEFFFHFFHFLTLSFRSWFTLHPCSRLLRRRIWCRFVRDLEVGRRLCARGKLSLTRCVQDFSPSLSSLSPTR
jgi:hypothetical protein